MILETESNTKWLVKSVNDEQVATYVGMKPAFEAAAAKRITNEV